MPTYPNDYYGPNPGVMGVASFVDAFGTGMLDEKRSKEDREWAMKQAELKGELQRARDARQHAGRLAIAGMKKSSGSSSDLFKQEESVLREWKGIKARLQTYVNAQKDPLSPLWGVSDDELSTYIKDNEPDLYDGLTKLGPAVANIRTSRVKQTGGNAFSPPPPNGANPDWISR